MKYIVNLVLLIMLGMIVTSCNSESGKMATLLAEVDSLKSANQAYAEEAKNMASFVNVISMCIDSIKVYEDSLLHRENGKETQKFSKEQLKSNLDAIKRLIERQKYQITQLKEQIDNSNSTYLEKIRKLVEYYEDMLNEKDHQISVLHMELDKKNVDISHLSTQVSKLITSNSQLVNKTELQNKALEAQSNMLNTCYVQIGTQKELSAKGLLSGGFLKKKKVDTAKLQAENFNKVDIRMFNDIVLQSKKPKILTQMPSSSYQLINNGDGTSTLHIINPSEFWSVSNFLIIQL